MIATKEVRFTKGNLPGSRKRGYGFVAMPMLIKVFSGLSKIFASQ